MDVREKLVELLGNIYLPMMAGPDVIGEYRIPHKFKKEIADHLIDHGVTVQEWVPASKPPEGRGCYLVSVKHWLDGKPVTREAFWNGADWLSCYWKNGDRVELTPRVTHWQHLPQPPKGE